MKGFRNSGWCLLAASLMILPVPASLSAQPLPLWPEGTPGARGHRPEDVPTLTAYLPPAGQASGASMLILPGGGYGHLASVEGEDYAKWFAARGITAYVLKYRLGSAGYRHPAMLDDAARGLRTVRFFARRDGLDPARVGIIGSSAGGHLASTLLTHFDAGKADSSDPIERESSRPDLGVLCYPVISLGEFAHAGSRENLLGKNPPPDLVQLLSNELHVTPETPPVFLWHTASDPAVPVENSLLFATALRKARVPFALHIFEKGGHGLALPTAGRGAPAWDGLCLEWLRSRGFLTAPPPAG